MPDSKIKSIKASKISNSRGKPTLDVEVETGYGKFHAGVPSGASKGEKEALAIDAGLAIDNVNKIIAPELSGKDASSQKELDQLMIEMDGTKNKSKLGANAIVGVSLALARAGAAGEGMYLWKYISSLSGQKPGLPVPTFNIINGGAHAHNGLPIQEFMAVADQGSPKENLHIVTEIYNALKKEMEKRYGKEGIVLGDEGGFAPQKISDPREAISLILKAAEDASFGGKIKIAMDAAASQFYKDGNYRLGSDLLSPDGLLDYYSGLVADYPVLSIEDPFDEESWQDFANIQEKLGDKIVIVGDDLLVTNIDRVREGARKKACSGMILKVNQVGTLTEGIEAGNLAKSFGWKVVVSHRSGETKDDFIADLAVGMGADFLKSGAPATEYRLAKYHRLLKIEEEI